MAALAIAPLVVDKILNHSSGKIAGMTNRAQTLAHRVFDSPWRSVDQVKS